ncbi:MAG: hypothetical protein GF364_02415 [Candidatus Lokiarchaeota archaeon]|nr:hypothetical protein [Candidatus Lokiarchaeota archaeon]
MSEKATTEILNTEWDSPIKPEYLTKFNKIMALLHLVQGILMIILGTIIDFPFQIYTFYFDYSGVGEGFPPVLDPQQIYTFNALGAAVGSFLLMSSFAHFLLAWPLNKKYIRNLKNHRNPLRWFEYAFSSSVMIVLIGMFFTITDIWTLFAMFMLNFLMNMFGMLMENENPSNENKKDVKWTAYILGCVAGIVPWIIITGYFLGANGTPPDFVYAIYIVEFVLFNCFAIVMLAYYKRWGKFKDYMFGERAYQLLSLIAKTLLAWIVFGGVFQPS